MKFQKRIMLFSLVASMLLPVNVFASTEAMPVETSYTASADGTEITPRADDIDWQYKLINGVLHKRLYNYSTNKPLGDWQIVT